MDSSFLLLQSVEEPLSLSLSQTILYPIHYLHLCFGYFRCVEGIKEIIHFLDSFWYYFLQSYRAKTKRLGGWEGSMCVCVCVCVYVWSYKKASTSGHQGRSSCTAAKQGLYSALSP